MFASSRVRHRVRAMIKTTGIAKIAIASANKNKTIMLDTPIADRGDRHQSRLPRVRSALLFNFSENGRVERLIKSDMLA